MLKKFEITVYKTIVSHELPNQVSGPRVPDNLIKYYKNKC